MMKKMRSINGDHGSTSEEDKGVGPLSTWDDVSISLCFVALILLGILFLFFIYLFFFFLF